MSKTRNNVSKRKKNVSTQEDKIAAFCNRNRGEGRGARGEGKRKDQDATIASLEKQIASLEEQVALLQVQSSKSKVQSGEDQSAKSKVQSGEDQKHFELCTLNFELPAPVLAIPTTAGDSVFLRWSEVVGATNIEISLAYDAEFTKPAGMMGVDGSRTWATLPEMYPDTTFFIRVKAFGDATHADSAYSNVRSVRTPPEGMAGTNDETATHLQTWLEQLQAEFQNFAALVPQLTTTDLNTADRKRLNGSGVRRYGFIEKTADVSGEFPQFWRATGPGTEELTAMVREIEVLRNLLVWFRWAARVVQDLLLMTGDDAFRLAGSYYTVARDEARRKNPEAQQVFEMLRLFWRRRRRMTEEPTEQELMRDFHALMRGTKNGTVSLTHESPTTSGGVHEVVDNVHSARCRVKETVKQSQHE